MIEPVTEPVPGQTFFMTVYRGQGGYFSETGEVATAKPLTELQPDPAQRRDCNRHFNGLYERISDHPYHGI